MAKYLKRLTLFLAIFIALFLVLFKMVDSGLKKSEYLDFAQWNAIYEGKIDADILIQGSSRAWRQVDPQIVDSITGKNSYNLGMDGYQVPMQMARYAIYEAHNEKPKYLVQILDHFSLSRREDLFNRDQFLPYSNDSILQKELVNYKGFGWADYHLPFYRYIGSQEVALAGLLEFFNLKKHASTRYKGFESRNDPWEPGFDTELAENPQGKRAELSLDVFKEFGSYLKSTSESGVEVILVYAPEYQTFQDYIVNRDTISFLYQSLANKYDCVYFDYKDHPVCQDKKYFYNPTHLNSEGAEIFSNHLASELVRIINGTNVLTEN